MRKGSVLLIAVSLLFTASCGGGGAAPEPTSAETQACAEAAVDAVISAGGEALLGALQPAAAQVVKTAYPIDPTAVNCDGGGTYTASGTITATCSGTTCTITDGPVTVVFTDCAKSVTIDSTTYNEVLNGTAGTNVTGTITGSEAEGVTAINASGTLSGTVTLTGTAIGEAVLDAVTWTATGTPDPDPTIGCDGTAVVTIEGQAAQNCSVASDCQGCEA